AHVAEVGCPDLAAAAPRIQSTRNCCPSSRSSFASIPGHSRYGPAMRVAVAFDHRGVHLRAAVLEALAGHDVVDLGTNSDAVRIDYPDKSREIGETILGGDAERGVLVCGSGVGASVAACQLPGIRAAICPDVYSAHQGVE